MAKEQNVVEALLGEGEAQGSALSLVGIADSGKDNLLDEALNKRLASANESGPKDFNETARQLKENFLGHKIEAPENLAKKRIERDYKKPSEAFEPKEDDEAEEEKAVAKTEVKEEPKSEEIPEPWHALNHRNQLLEQRIEQQDRAYQQKMTQLERMQQQMAQSMVAAPEVPYEQFGFESPDQYKLLRSQLKSELQQELRQEQAPLYFQMAQDRFAASIARLSSQNDHFNDYFPDNSLWQMFNQISQNYAPDFLAKVNWEAELKGAYDIKDAPRLRQELDKLRKENEALKEAPDSKKQEKQDRKSHLKSVPKASNQGLTKPTTSYTDLETGGGFDNISAQLKKRLFAR